MTDKILELADEGKLDEALQKVLEMKPLITQIDYLKQLAWSLAKSNEGRELIRMLDEAARRRDSQRVQMLHLDRAREFAGQLFVGDHPYQRLLIDSLTNIVDGLANNPPRPKSRVEEVKPEEAIVPGSQVYKAVQLAGIDALTPQSLGRDITPYLQNLVDLQQVLAEIKKQEYIEARLLSIKEDNLIRVDINNLSEAIQTVLKVIIPFRRGNAKKLAQYAVMREKIDFGKKKVVSLTDEAHFHLIRQQMETTSDIDRERYRIELQLATTEVERLELENRTLAIEIGMELAYQIVADLPQEDRPKYVPRLAPILTALASSRLEIVP